MLRRLPLWLASIPLGVFAVITVGCAGVDAVPATFGDLPRERHAIIADSSVAAFRLTIRSDSENGSRDVNRTVASVARVTGGREDNGVAFLRIELLEHSTLPAGTVVNGRATDDHSGGSFRNDAGDPVPDAVVTQAIAAITMDWFPAPGELAGRTVNPGDEWNMPVDTDEAIPGSMGRPRWTSRIATYRGVLTHGDSPARWAVFDVTMTGEIDTAFDGDVALRGLQVRGPVNARGRVFVLVDDPGVRDGELSFPVKLEGAGVMLGQSFTCEVDGRMTKTYKSTNESARPGQPRTDNATSTD